MNITTLEMSRGDARKWLFAVTDSGTGAAFDISGCSMWFTAKKRLSDTDLLAVFQKTVGDGITVTDALNGLGYIQLAPTDTTTLENSKTQQLEFDFQLTQGSNPYTLAFGKLTVYGEVTLTY